MNEPSTTRTAPVYAVCADCAHAHGAFWPRGHLATMSVSHCDACGQAKVTCSVGDWDWPKGKPRGWRGSGRD